MNNRQKLKKLKRDNELMHKIINDSEKMKRLYDDFNSPIRNVVHTTMHFQEFRSKRKILPMLPKDDITIEYYKQDLALELSHHIRPMIKFTSYDDVIEASIFIGKNRNEISN